MIRNRRKRSIHRNRDLVRIFPFLYFHNPPIAFVIAAVIYIFLFTINIRDTINNIIFRIQTHLASCNRFNRASIARSTPFGIGIQQAILKFSDNIDFYWKKFIRQISYAGTRPQFFSIWVLFKHF